MLATTVNLIDNANILALIANVLAERSGLVSGIALVAQSSALTFDESGVGQFAVALLAAEASWMPIGAHSFDYSADDEFSCFREFSLLTNSCVVFTRELCKSHYRIVRNKEQREPESRVRSTCALRIRRKYLPETA